MTTSGQEVLEAFITNSKGSEALTLANFVMKNKDTIASTIKPGEDFRAHWSLLFRNMMRKHGKKLVTSDPDWDSVSVVYVKNLMSSQASTTKPASKDPNIRMRNSPSNSNNPSNSNSPSSFSSSICSTNSNSGAYSLQPNDKNKISETYDAWMKDETKLWHLKNSNTIVETKMKEYALKCNFEHPCHSFILDPWDQTWNDVFTEDELTEIISEKVPEFPPLPAPLQDYMNKFSNATTLDQLREIALANTFHPLENPQLHWMEGSILKVLDVLYYDIINKYKSEADLMKRIWCFIDCAFDVGDVSVVAGEYVSKSSSARINNGRTLSGVDVLERKKTGAKVDLLFTTAINEMGTAEAGKHTDTDTTKATIEYGIKTPKVMKDMMYDMVTKNKSLLRDIKTFGFIISGLQILPMIMDCPAGIVCRISRPEQYLCFPTTAQNFKSRMEALFRMVYTTKTSMEKILNHLDTQPVNISFVRSGTPIPPCFTHFADASKKRKISKKPSPSEPSSSSSA